MTRIQANLLLLMTAMIWGFAFLYQKSAMQHVGPVAFVAARAVVACIALLPVIAYEHSRAGELRFRFVAWRAIPAGAAFFLGALLQQAGIVTASVTNTGFLTALYVVITPMIAWLLMGRRPDARVWIAIGLSATGVWFLGGGGLDAFGTGDLLVAASAIFWALHVVLLGIGSQPDRPALFTALQFAVVAVLALALLPAADAPSLAGLKSALPEILFVGVLSSAVTFTFFTMAVRHTGPNDAVIIVSSETLFAALAGWWVLGESLPLIAWCGAALIVMAIFSVQLRRRSTPPH